MRTTDRGFGIYDEFVDSRGTQIRVQQSSRADDDFFWIFSFYKDDLREAETSLHLTKDEAKRLLNAIQDWLDGFTP